MCSKSQWLCWAGVGEDTKPEEKSGSCGQLPGRIYLLRLVPVALPDTAWCTVQRLQRACEGGVSQEVVPGRPLKGRGLSLLFPRGTVVCWTCTPTAHPPGSPLAAPSLR